MEYKGIIDTGTDFEMFVDIDDVTPARSVLIGTNPSDIAAASIVGVGLAHMAELTGTDQEIADLCHMYDNMNPPSIKEWYRDQMESKPEELVTNIVATPTGTDLGITFTAPTGLNPAGYLVVVRNTDTGTEVGRAIVSTESATISFAGHEGADATVDVRVNDTVYYNTAFIGLTLP